VLQFSTVASRSYIERISADGLLTHKIIVLLLSPSIARQGNVFWLRTEYLEALARYYNLLFGLGDMLLKSFLDIWVLGLFGHLWQDVCLCAARHHRCHPAHVKTDLFEFALALDQLPLLSWNEYSSSSNILRLAPQRLWIE